jgi:hypothetical protein
MLLSIFGSYSIDMECKFGKVYWFWRHVTPGGTECIVQNLKITGETLNITQENQHITSINDDVASDAFYKHVTILRIENQPVHYFPHGIEKFFPNIERIRFAWSRLKAVKKRDIEVFPKLIDLDLNGNRILRLDNNLFENNPKIIFLSFYRNKINVTGENTFEPLKNLLTLDLEYNQCIYKGALNDENKVKRLVEETKTKCSRKLKSNTDKVHSTLVLPLCCLIMLKFFQFNSI